MKTKLLVYLAVWKRPEITELCFLGLNRLRKHPGFDIEVLAVISEEEMIPLCERYNVNHTFHSNTPLGKKKNYGLSAARNFHFDYILEIGSDDLILNELLDLYQVYIGVFDFFGVKDVAYIDSASGSCRRLQSNGTYGAGRMIRRDILEKTDFKLWDENIDRALDNNSVYRLQRMGIGYRHIQSGSFPMVIDVKSDINIWKFNHLVGIEYDINNILEKISIEEKQKLCLICPQLQIK